MVIIIKYKTQFNIYLNYLNNVYIYDQFKINKILKFKFKVKDFQIKMNLINIFKYFY